MSSEPETISLRVEPEQAGQRLDVFLSKRMAGPSRSVIQAWIKEDRVLVDGEPAKARYQVRAGDQVEINRPAPEPSALVPEPIPLSVVYEDEWLIVVDKPAGLVTHPGAGIRKGTLANALLYHFAQLSQTDTVRPGIVHRLDRLTSGLLVVAKTEQIHDLLGRQFQRREVEKRYTALVYGHLDKKQGSIDVPLGRDPVARMRISTRSRKPRSALTEYEVIREMSHFSLLRVNLHTGRTHQIRVHLQYLKHPVVGDETYGGEPRRFLKDGPLIKAIESLGRHFLHAGYLAFVHPALETRLALQSPLPAELAQLLTRLE